MPIASCCLLGDASPPAGEPSDGCAESIVTSPSRWVEKVIHADRVWPSGDDHGARSRHSPDAWFRPPPTRTRSWKAGQVPRPGARGGPRSGEEESWLTRKNSNLQSSDPELASADFGTPSWRSAPIRGVHRWTRGNRDSLPGLSGCPASRLGGLSIGPSTTLLQDVAR